MVDTARTQTDLLTNLFQDGQTAGISANDIRDLIVSLSPAYGEFYISSSAATTVSASGTYYKAAGTTTLGASVREVDDNSVSNRLRYTGTPTRAFLITVSVSVSFASGTNQIMGLQLWKYDDSAASGALVTGSEIRRFVSSSDVGAVAITALVEMDTNDYIELHVANHSGTPNIEVEYGHVSVLGLIT